MNNNFLDWQIDLFKKLNLYEGTFAQSILWLIFLILGIAIIISADYVSKMVITLSERLNISKAIAGALILSFITGIPELTTMITSSALGYPETGFSNTIGSNLFRMFSFSIIILIFMKKIRQFKQAKNNYEEWSFITCVIIGVLLLIFVFIPNNLNNKDKPIFSWLQYSVPTINISVIILIIFVAYVSAFGILGIQNHMYYRKNPFAKISNAATNEIKRLQAPQLNLTKLCLLFVFWTIILIICSFAISIVVDIAPHTYHIPDTSVSGLFLSIVTNAPDIVATIVLLKHQEFKIAQSNLFGTLSFNLMLPFFGDIAFRREGILTYLVQNNDYRQWFILLLMQLIMVFNISFMTYINPSKKIYKINYGFASANIVIYIVGWTIALLYFA